MSEHEIRGTSLMERYARKLERSTTKPATGLEQLPPQEQRKLLRRKQAEIRATFEAMSVLRERYKVLASERKQLQLLLGEDDVQVIPEGASAFQRKSSKRTKISPELLGKVKSLLGQFGIDYDKL